MFRRLLEVETFGVVKQWIFALCGRFGGFLVDVGCEAFVVVCDDILVEDGSREPVESLISSAIGPKLRIPWLDFNW